MMVKLLSLYMSEQNSKMTMEIQYYFSLWYCLLLNSLLIGANGSAIEFNSSLSALSPLTNNMTLRCSFHDTKPSVSGSHLIGRKKRAAPLPHSNDTNALTSTSRRGRLTNTAENIDLLTYIAIAKDGVNIAEISDHQPARDLINSPDIQVTGSLTGQADEKGYLELIWRNPTKDQSGNYSCEVDSVNKLGHAYDFSKSLELKYDVSLEDILKFVREIEQDKNDLTKTVNELTKAAQLTNGVVQLLNSTVSDQQKEIWLLQQNNQNLVSLVNQMQTKIFFSVAVTKGPNYTIQDGQVVMYDHVFLNEGGAYHLDTGSFVCPLDGIYSFFVSTESSIDSPVSLRLQHNTNNVLYMFSLNSQGFQDVANQVILKLSKHDVIRVVSAGVTYMYTTPTEVTSTFNGQLLALL